MIIRRRIGAGPPLVLLGACLGLLLQPSTGLAQDAGVPPAEPAAELDGSLPSVGERGRGVKIERGVVEERPGFTELPDPRACSRCYETLQRQTHDCWGMANEVDRDICLDAARVAYHRCSKTC